MDRVASRSLMSCLTDEQMRVVDADDDYVAMLGYGRERLIGRSVLEFTHQDDRTVNRQRSEALLAGGDPFSITKRYIAADGSAIWVTNHVSLFHTGTNRRQLATVEVLETPRVEDQRRLLRVAAERILAKRRLRSLYFEGEMFGEPAFDLLLDLFVQELSHRQTYTTSAAVASGAPLTTALRQITMLVERGLVCREADPVDRRRVLLRLTSAGNKQMWEYLAAAEKI
ncbi:PAS domain S-box protein [Sphingomonas sp. BK580]|uniref:PAS domain S-box protein n=1 Tax=Sphingomonas sp. BK580 TaxID=2586972 RepID=UPI00162107E3|nr:PAS domain S-box protein [Sphingomonas sp. BK580]MBB3695426.1 PAS domain S-box-containing protein [Sphingomonas sp. BK580]